MKKKAAAGGSENIRVVVRVRPLSGKEKEGGSKEAVQVDVSRGSVAVKQSIGSDADMFTFDAVYNFNYSQKDIYTTEVYPLVESVLAGYNATVFAYGQSGSGKTHTMTGDPKIPELMGMMPNAIHHIFESVNKMRSSQKIIKLKMSHLELYNGKAKDLLCGNDKMLEIKQNLAKNFYVKDLTEREVTNVAETLKLYDDSLERRRVGVTDLNEHSSRSHSILSVIMEVVDYEHDSQSPQIVHSKLNLVDLAGSERQGKTGAQGDTLKEGCNINLSLSALGTVIDTIVKGEKHIPYRSSPLTMLLKDSLGGNSKTVMFANCGPADRNVSETISTLRFAMRAKQIQNKPVKNLDPKDAKIQQLLEKIDELQKRLGGDGDFESNDILKEKIEELVAQIDALRRSHETEVLEFNLQLQRKDAEKEDLVKQLEEKERSIAQLNDDQEIKHRNAANNSDEVKELKRAIFDFVRSTTTEQELKKIQSKKKNDNINLDNLDGELSFSQLYLLVDGAKEAIQLLRKNTITNEDVNKLLAEQERSQSYEFDSRFNTFRKQTEQEKMSLVEAKKQLQEKVDTLDKESAQIKVEFEKAKGDLDASKKKADRDKKKMMEKMERAVEELKKYQDQFDKEKAEWEDKKKEESTKDEMIVKELKAQLNDLQETASKKLAAEREEWETLRKSLEKQLEERSYDQQQLQTQVSELECSVRKIGGKPGNASRRDLKVDVNNTNNHHHDNGEHIPKSMNDGMIADEDGFDRGVFEAVSHQIRVHSHLQSIRHQQQIHLENLLKTHRELQQQQQQVSDEKAGEIRKEYEAKITAMTEELQSQKDNNEKEVDKIVKKANRKMAEFEKLQNEWAEEKKLADEEKKELLNMNEELSKLNKSQMQEIESFKRKFETTQEQRKGDELSFIKRIESMKQDIDEANRKLAESEKKLSEIDKLKKEIDGYTKRQKDMESQLQEKIQQLDSQRTRANTLNTFVEKERKVREELVKQLEQEKKQQVLLEEGWRQKFAEATQNLIAAHTIKLREKEKEKEAAVDSERAVTAEYKKKLKKSKLNVEKEKKKFDELMCEYDVLMKSAEDTKEAALKATMERSTLNLIDGVKSYDTVMQREREKRKQESAAFAGKGFS